jgi:hypothetical protein
MGNKDQRTLTQDDLKTALRKRDEKVSGCNKDSNSRENVIDTYDMHRLLASRPG